jgi:MraZ protein
VFLGTYQTYFSGKGRVILPKKFRAELKQIREVVLTRGLDGCIWGFDKKHWEKEARAQLETPITEKRGRDLRRLIFSGTEIAELDNQGRFIIPSALLSYAGIKQGVVIVGVGDHIEIWDPDAWNELFRKGIKVD